MAESLEMTASVGRKLNKRMDNKAVDKLFMGLMVLIVAICVYNALRAFIPEL